ncbi:MAG: phosphomannomutase [Rhodothermales bacterium]|jgi:phosphomannomutase
MRKTLMVSISGIRGIFGSGLDPEVLVRYTSAFGAWCAGQPNSNDRPLVIVGRDARVTGQICSQVVCATLQAVGCRVIDLGLATTPTVEMAVIGHRGQGGIVLSASHNPAEWNALKLLNGKGEFLSPEEGREVIDLAEQGADLTVPWDKIGSLESGTYLDEHIQAILDLPFIDPGAIANRDFRVVVDGINSIGGVAIPALLRAIGVRDEQIVRVNCDPTGLFAHVAEPLPENLIDTIEVVRTSGADIGIVVDPDADRLALIQDGGVYFSEELTQVVAADFLWRFRTGPFATNLSSSRAIEDVAARYGAAVHRSAVGEINVVKKMQEVGAVLGGEGNGGVILPDLHYGRDGLVGTAMVLQHLANLGASMTDVRADLPAYHIVKQKTQIGDLDPDALLGRMLDRYAGEQISTIDGVKIDFEEGWVHMRKSNTEPIIRVYSEASTQERARELGQRFMAELVA